MGDPLELERHLGRPLGQSLPRPDVDGDPGPPPVVDGQLHGHIGLGPAVGIDVGLVAVAGDGLAADGPGRVLAPHRRPHGLVDARDDDGLEELDLLVPDALGLDLGRRFHEGQGQDLHDVVLDDVPQRAGRLVETAPVLDPELLGHRDLNVVDVAPVPDRLEDGVGEAQGQNVLDRLLAHVVVDPEDLRFVEGLVESGVQGQGAGQVAAEGLLHQQPGERAGLRGRTTVFSERGGHRAEEVGDGGQIEDPVPRRPQLLVELVQHRLQLIERVGMAVLAGDVAEAFDQFLPGVARFRNRLQRHLLEVLVAPGRPGHPHHGEPLGQGPVVGQPGDGGEEFPRRQVPRRPEHDEDERRRLADRVELVGHRLGPRARPAVDVVYVDARRRSHRHAMNGAVRPDRRPAHWPCRSVTA